MAIINLPIETAISAKTGGLLGIANADRPEIKEYNRNLLDWHDMTVGKYIKSDGTMADLNNSQVSGFIKVSRAVYPYLAFKVRVGGSDATALKGITFYGINHSVVFWSRTAADLPVTGIEIPDGAAYARIEIGYNSASPNGWWAVMKYACFGLSLYETAQYVKPDGPNLLNADTLYLNRGVYPGGISVLYTETTGSVLTSPMIPVIPGKRYYIGCGMAASTAFYTFDKNGENQARAYDSNVLNFWTCPDNVGYIVLIVKDADGVDRRKTGVFLGIVPLDDAPGVKMIADNDDVAAFYRRKEDLPFVNSKKTIGLFENYVFYRQSTNEYYFGEEGVGGSMKPFSNSLLPGYANRPLMRVAFFYTAARATGLKALVFDDQNRVWCSRIAPAYDAANTYAVGDICSYSGQNYKCVAEATGTWDSSKWEKTSNVLGYFETCNIWDIKGNRSWRVGEDETDPTGTRYRKHYPSGETARLNKLMWHNAPVWLSFGGQYAHGLLWGNYSTTTENDKAEPACLYLTLNGKDIYVMYEFGVNGTYKLGSAGEVQRWGWTAYGDDVDFSGFSGDASGMKVRRRASIVPTADETDPTELFDYGSEIAITAISGKNITLADASGLSAQDTIVLTGSGTGDYAKLLTTTIDETTGVGDGNVFVIKSVSGNVITIADGIGNPKNNLFCRHIHGISEFGQGVCFYTGEEYPAGWFVYLEPGTHALTDADCINSTMWQSSVLRLNSSPSGHQRSLGVYLRPDGKMISVSDSPSPWASRISVRGKSMVMCNYGVHVFDIEDIDDAAKIISKIPTVNAAYALFRLGSVLYFCDYLGKTYYSKDEGDTWNYICEDGIPKHKIIGWDENKTRFWLDLDSDRDFVIKVKK